MVILDLHCLAPGQYKPHPRWTNPETFRTAVPPSDDFWVRSEETGRSTHRQGSYRRASRYTWQFPQTGSQCAVCVRETTVDSPLAPLRILFRFLPAYGRFVSSSSFAVRLFMDFEMKPSRVAFVREQTPNGQTLWVVSEDWGDCPYRFKVELPFGRSADLGPLTNINDLLLKKRGYRLGTMFHNFFFFFRKAKIYFSNGGFSLCLWLRCHSTLTITGESVKFNYAGVQTQLD